MDGGGGGETGTPGKVVLRLVDPLPESSQVADQTVEAIAFGPTEELDFLGETVAEIDRPFVDAMRLAMAAAPQLQGAIDQFGGRLLRLTPEAAKLLRDFPQANGAALGGVVRNPENGQIVGHLKFIDATGVAGLAGALPSIAGAAAMQFQLMRIEKALDGLKKDLGYLIRKEHLNIEAEIETNLEILNNAYAEARSRGFVGDALATKLAILEPSVRSLHKETRKHLRSLEEALGSSGERLAVRVAKLNRALDDERTVFWLRAHVHAELALARWDALDLLRQAQERCEGLEALVGRLDSQLEDRHRVLAELSQGITRYLSTGGKVVSLIDRLRIVRKAKLKALLIELDELLKVFPAELAVVGAVGNGEAAIPLAVGSVERNQWDRLVAGARSLPQAVVPALKAISDHVPGRNREDRAS